MSSNGDWVTALREQHSTSQKSWAFALLLSVLFGYFGADRFYVGRTGLGLAKLLTCGGGGVWWVVDIVLLLTGEMKDELGKKVQRSNG